MDNFLEVILLMSARLIFVILFIFLPSMDVAASDLVSVEKRDIYEIKFKGVNPIRLDPGRNGGTELPLKIENKEDGTEIWHCNPPKEDDNWSVYIPIFFPNNKPCTIYHDLFAEFDIYMDMNEKIEFEIRGILGDGIGVADQSWSKFHWVRRSLSDWGLPLPGKKNPTPWKSGRWIHCVASLSPAATELFTKDSKNARYGYSYRALSIYIDVWKRARVRNVKIKNFRFYRKYDKTMQNLNKLDSAGFTKFHYMCMAGDVPLMKQAMQSGAKLGVLGDWCQHPIQFAAISGKTDAVDYLMSKGANVNQRSIHYLGTPLRHAIAGRNLDMIKCLLRHGANPQIAIDGTSGVKFCELQGYKEALKLLQAAIEKNENKLK